MIASILLGLFILFAYTAEAVTGFGSIVIALSLGALFFPIEWLQSLLVPLNIVMTGYLGWRHRRHIDTALLLRLILPFMLMGTALGVLLQPVLGGQLMKLAFALLILWFALRELRRLRGGLAQRQKPLWWSRLMIGAAGVTHGLFASGGPLLVYGLSGRELDKARFRATLILVWLTLNAALTLVFLWQGRIQAQWPYLLLYLPLIPLGIWIGEHLHHRIDDLAFRRWVYRLLAVAGLGLLIATLADLLQGA